ncbi:O-antigen ligase family protein [Verrucomicrobiota bacterium]
MSPESNSNSSHKRKRSEPVTRAEEWLVVALLLLVGYPMWILGGTQVAAQGPLPWLGAAAMLAAIIARAAYEKQRRSRPWSRALRRSIAALFRTSALYPGLLFLVLLVIQWANAGRELSYDIDAFKWYYKPPPVPWLPSAIAREDAAEMLRWFFPAGCAALAVQLAIVRKRTARFLYGGIVALTALLAFLSTAQFVFARYLGVGMEPARSYFVSSFGYPNHAGIFFNLVFCLGVGLLLESVFRSGAKRRGAKVLLGMGVVLCFVGATVSLSRAALVLSWALALATAIYAFAVDWRTLSDGEKFSKGMFLFGLACVVFFVVHGTGRDIIRREFLDGASLKPWEDVSLQNIAADPERYRKAVEASDSRCLTIGMDIWRDHVWLGAGGWAQSHLAALYIPSEEWHWARLPGKANTHSDPVQFLGEFGVVGFGLMLFFWGCLIVPVFMREKTLMQPMPLFCTLGVHIVLVYSFVDLPLRCPAVLIAWAMIAGGLRREVQVDGRGKGRRPRSGDALGGKGTPADGRRNAPTEEPGDKRVCT